MQGDPFFLDVAHGLFDARHHLLRRFHPAVAVVNAPVAQPYVFREAGQRLQATGVAYSSEMVPTRILDRVGMIRS